MSGKGSEETIAQLTQNMTTSLTGKVADDASQPHILVLLSTTSGSRSQLSHQERAIHMLEALEIPFATLNCALPEHRDRRNELFEISGVRGLYPQFFLVNKERTTPTYIGDWDVIERANENAHHANPDELAPDALTWDRIMGTVDTYNTSRAAERRNVRLSQVVRESQQGADNDDNSSQGSGGLYADL